MRVCTDHKIMRKGEGMGEARKKKKRGTLRRLLMVEEKDGKTERNEVGNHLKSRERSRNV